MNKNISDKVINRLTLYHCILSDFIDKNIEYISSKQIAQLLHIDDSQVRKDINLLNNSGKSRIGYIVKELKTSIEKTLGFKKTKKALIIGAGNLGTAIANYGNFTDYGLKILAIFDNDKNTLWMARCEDESNPPYIIIDLGENAAPENLEVSFYQGKSRTYYYSVYTSTDNVSFAPLMTDKSTTRADGFEKISLNGMNARYIKLVVKGSSFGSWALIEELRVK